MSYTKQTWATGDTITADKLNHIETGIAAASYYDNVEKSVVYFDKHDLVPVSGSGMPTGVYALSENDFPLDTVFDNDELKITLNSEEFTVQKQFDSDTFAYYYGTNLENISDKDADPFTYIYSADENDRRASFICIGLAQNSTVDLKIEGLEYRKEPTNEFKEAVKAVSSAVSPMVIRVGYNQLTCDKTGAEVFNAISNGIPCFLIEQKMKQTLDGFYYRMLPLIDAEEQDDGYHFTFTDNNKNCGYVVYVSSTSSPYLTYSTTENDR